MRPAFTRPIQRVSNPFEVRCVLLRRSVGTRSIAANITTAHPNLAAAEQRIRQLLADEVDAAPRAGITAICLERVSWGVNQAGGYGLIRRTVKVVHPQADA